MKLPLHIETIYKLYELRKIINETTDISLMMQTAYQAVEITKFITTIKEGKNRIIGQLLTEIRTYSKSNTEIEVIQFQLSSTILMLCLQFIEGTLTDMNTMIIEFEKKAA